MIIDTEGSINIENLGMKIDPDFTLDALKANPHFADFRFWGSNDGYARYGIKGMLIDNLPFSGIFVFYKNKISEIRMGYSAFISKASYDEPEKLNEQLTLTNQKHEELLIQQHGATRKKFPWGLIGSVIDTRSVGADIVIIYNNPPFEHWKEFLKSARFK